MSRTETGDARASVTKPATAMAQVVASIAPSLKARGFKKQRHSFNRVAEPGLVHVINFQMGQFPPGAQEIPGFRPNLSGKFTVNLGVLVAEVYEATQRTSVPSFVQEYSCEFRVRLGELMRLPSDQWWSLEEDVAKLSANLGENLRVLGEAWFALYATREAIVRIPERGAPPAGWPARAGVALAVMRMDRGERAEAQSLLRDYLAQELVQPRNPRHRDWVLELARRLGFADGELA
jgi:hypothetical protein